MKDAITRSELVHLLAEHYSEEELPKADISMSVMTLIEFMGNAVANGERIEVRGFGSFTLRQRKPRMGRNPKTGEAVPLGIKHVPYFKPGKALKDSVKDKVGE